MKITAFDGSPRKNGNSTIILKNFLEHAEYKKADIKLYKTDDLDLKPCRGCLMCNVLKRCVIRNDDWDKLAAEILSADILTFASPIYFHHATSSMKKLLDRFRSFIRVQITEEGLIHTPHEPWNKKIFLFTAHGSSTPDDAKPLIELFEFMNEILGRDNEFKYLTAVRLAVSGQILFDEEQMINLYKKIGLPQRLVQADIERNRKILGEAGKMGENIFK